MKYSIKNQIMAMFIGLMVLIMAGVSLLNSGFLERYYTVHMVRDFEYTYQSIDNALKDGSFESGQIKAELQALTEKKGISITIMDVGTGKMIYSTSLAEKDALFARMLGYFFGKNKEEHVKEKTDHYMIQRAKDPDNQMEYLEMWGTFSDGSYFTMRTSFDNMRESARIANEFLLYIGMAVVIFGGVLIWFFSRRIARPILELAELSKSMANLDFEARYTHGGSNEIGVLGENFNTMSKRLEATISELKTANNQLKKDIEQKEKLEEMRNEFLGNVSHELKTPLALIQGYAEGLKEGISSDPDSMEFYCDVIIDEAGKMNQMVRNLLTLNQLEFGSEDLQFDRFDIVSQVKGVLASCDILIQQAGAKVDFIADGPYYVWADEFKTEQVIRNYLTNALHHVDNEKRIEIRIIPETDKVRVTVFNSGTPIPQEDLARLWDKFYKVDKAHTREYGGNGIGLSIVKAIMESFHQDYGVRNFTNGVEFWFELDASCEDCGCGAKDGCGC